MGFESQKKQFLGKQDKSKKGSIDEELKPLIGLINSSPAYYTTSSCSGRIVLLKGRAPKKGAQWLFISHAKASLKEIKGRLKKPAKDGVWLRQEPMIMHVCCRTIDDASKLLNAARNTFKRSGIIAINRKIVLEILGTDYLDTLIAEDCRVLADDIYLSLLISEANKKLSKNREKINKLYKELKKLFLR